MYVQGATTQNKEIWPLKPQSQKSCIQVDFAKGENVCPGNHISEQRNLALEASEPHIVSADNLCKGKIYVLGATSQNREIWRLKLRARNHQFR